MEGKNNGVSCAKRNSMLILKKHYSIIGARDLFVIWQANVSLTMSKEHTSHAQYEPFYSNEVYKYRFPNSPTVYHCKPLMRTDVNTRKQRTVIY